MPPMNQKSPSPFMLLAIGQTAIWMFVLPKVCRPLWGRIFGSLSQKQAEILLNMIPFFFNLAYSTVMLPIYYIRHPFFEQYKIQKDKCWPWADERPEIRRAFWKLSLSSVKYLLINMVILIPILTVLKVKAFQWLDLDGISFKTDNESWPTTEKMISDNIALTILHEFAFYVTHRLMHTYPSLYKHHKVHHEYKMNTVLAAQHNDWVDFIISIGTPALLCTVIVKPHGFTQFQWGLWVMYANLDDHVGYSFPWSPVRWFPFAALTEEHEFHHSKNMGCFGSKLDIFNRIFGGHEHYLKWTEQRKQA